LTCSTTWLPLVAIVSRVMLCSCDMVSLPSRVNY
jgi:hypothetical protein